VTDTEISPDMINQLRTIGWTVALAATGVLVTRPSRAPDCAPDNGGITLPTGFCATVFADSLPAPRHLWVMPNGDVFVSLMGRGGRGGATPVPGGVIMLRDANKDGKADMTSDVARGFQSSEVAVFDNHLYTENGTAVFRFPMKNGEATPSGWIAEQTSCTNPGSVSSAERVPPPTESAASRTRTDSPARASAIAAASPFGPAPTTTASGMAGA